MNPKNHNVKYWEAVKNLSIKNGQDPKIAEAVADLVLSIEYSMTEEDRKAAFDNFETTFDKIEL
jgi:hypothetical protein